MPAHKKHASARARRNRAATAATLIDQEPDDRSGWSVKELRAEIDARNADGRDADERLSKGGGKAAMIDVLLEDDFAIPVLPDRPAGWHEMTETWWRDQWMSPMHHEWHPESDWHNVIIAAMHYDDMWRSNTAVERQKATASLLNVCKPLGLNPLARRTLEWTIENAAEARERGQKRRGQNSGQPAPAPPPSGAADPRAQLHAVK